MNSVNSISTKNIPLSFAKNNELARKIANGSESNSVYHTSLPSAVSSSVADISKAQIAQVGNVPNSKDAKDQKSIPSTKNPVFIAMTGGFKGDGSDVTKDVAGNSSSEEIFMMTQQKLQDKGIKMDGLFIAPGKECDTTLNTARDFIAQQHQPDEKLVVYGYSNGGRCAVDLVTALQKDKTNVDLLVTVDATDRKNRIFGTNSTVDTTTPANVKVHHNFYQQDECGLLTCPQGESHQAEDASSTKVINHQTKAEKIENPEYKNKIHRSMEDINRQPILEHIYHGLDTGNTQ